MASVAEVEILARDGYRLGGTTYVPEVGDTTRGTVVVHGATGVPHRFYRRFAHALADEGFAAITYDYRGIAASRRGSLRGFDASMTDWALNDMAGVMDWAPEHHPSDRTFIVGHSFGGQTAGLLDNVGDLTGMVTVSSQSGYWGHQGGEQKWLVGFHAYVTLPLLTRAVGYSPWSKVGAGEDLPRGVALQWSSWCRHPDYLLSDGVLPLERYVDFGAPVLAYSIADDKWGTRASVDAWMSNYEHVERRHIVPTDHGISKLGHMGWFKAGSESLWGDALDWMRAQG